MACFSFAWVLNFLIWLVVVAAVVAIVRLVLPIILGWLGIAGELVMQVINIILIASAIILVLVFAYDLLTCAGVFHGAR